MEAKLQALNSPHILSYLGLEGTSVFHNSSDNIENKK